MVRRSRETMPAQSGKPCITTHFDPSKEVDGYADGRRGGWIAQTSIGERTFGTAAQITEEAAVQALLHTLFLEGRPGDREQYFIERVLLRDQPIVTQDLSRWVRLRGPDKVPS